MAGPRMTIPVQRVLQVLLADPTVQRYGLEIGNAAGLRSGTVHPILARLEAIGWAESEWEEIDARIEGRPPRRYYRLTGQGSVHAREALARAHRARPSASSIRPAIEGA